MIVARLVCLFVAVLFLPRVLAAITGHESLTIAQNLVFATAATLFCATWWI